MGLLKRSPKHSRRDSSTAMTRETENANDREGLLETNHNPSRSTFNDDNSSTSDLSLDELEQLDAASGSRLRGGWAPLKKGGKTARDKMEGDYGFGPSTKRRGGCLRSKWFWLTIALLTAALVVLLACSSWIFKEAVPQDGVCFPDPTISIR